jgi:hypothetical protein
VTPATHPARMRWRPVVLACGLWALVVLGLVATAWLDHLLRRAGRPDLARRGAQPVPAALAALSAATVGAVVASRRPSHPVGWLLLGLGLSLPWSDVLDGYVDYGQLARPGSLPAARDLAVYSPAMFMAGLACTGLYDLDRIISRTLAYGLLMVLLGGGYALIVLGLGQLLGQDSSLVVAATALAVAALFQPARRRIQQGVDRRFNRRRHDAAHTIATFSTRLRDQVDLTTLTGELLAVVDQTMQPTRASLWLRPQAKE